MKTIRQKSVSDCQISACLSVIKVFIFIKLFDFSTISTSPFAQNTNNCNHAVDLVSVIRAPEKSTKSRLAYSKQLNTSGGV